MANLCIREHQRMSDKQATLCISIQHDVGQSEQWLQCRVAPYSAQLTDGVHPQVSMLFSELCRRGVQAHSQCCQLTSSGTGTWCAHMSAAASLLLPDATSFALNSLQSRAPLGR